MARVLGPTAYGTIGILLVLVGFAQAYSDLGLSAALIYRRDDTSEERSSLYWANVLAGMAIALVAVIVAPAIGALFHHTSITPYLRVLSLELLIIPFGQQFCTLLEKELSFRSVSLLESAGSFVSSLVTIALVLLGLGIWGFVIGALVGQAVTTGAFMWIGWRRFRPLFHLRWPDIQSYIGFGLYQLGERTLNYVSQRADQVLVAVFLGPAALGFYNFASNITSQLASRINPLVTRVTFPLLAAAQDDLPRLRRGFLDMVELLTAVNAPILLGLIVIAPHLIPLVFGDKWHTSILLVQLLAAGALVRTVGNPIGSLQNARGRADLGFVWNVLAVCVVIPTVALGAYLDGIVGVAVGIAIDQVFLLTAGFPRLIQPLAALKLRPYLASFMRPIALAALMAAIVYSVGTLMASTSDTARLTVEVAVGVLSYIVLLWMLSNRILVELAGVVGVRLPGNRASGFMGPDSI